MTRLHTCGFEENNFTATMWNSVVGSPAISTTHVHSGTYAMRINPSAATMNVTRIVPVGTTSGTWYHRLYLYMETLPGGTVDFFRQRPAGGGGTSRTLQVLSTGQLQIINGVTGTNVSSTINLSADVWYRIEIRHLFGAAGVGQIEVRVYVGDATSASDTFGIGNFTGGNGTNEDTDNTQSEVNYGQVSTTQSPDFYFDDIAWNNDSGTFQNSWCGPGKIVLRTPASDDTVAWTDATGTGTGNAGEVDELPGAPDDDTSYVTSSTANQEDRYNLSAMPAEVTSDADMLVVDVYARIRGEGTTSTRQCRVLLWDEGGSQTNGPTTALNDSTAYAVMGTGDHLVYDPGTKTKANLDSFDAGAEPLTAHATRLTAIWVNVEWLEIVASTDVFFENRHPIEEGMKPLTAAGIGGVLIE